VTVAVSKAEFLAAVSNGAQIDRDLKQSAGGDLLAAAECPFQQFGDGSAI
jgi:hypothetical protein